MSVRRTLTRNTAFNAAGRFWDAASGLVLQAYILDRIGMAAWGLWAFVNVFTSYVGLVDFGVGSSFAKYIAEHAARDEDDEVTAVVSTGFFFYLVLGGLIVGVGMLDLSVTEYYLQTKASVGLTNLWIGLFHGVVFGVLVALSGCLKGLQCGRSASAVGDATTAAVVTGIVAIIVATAIITIVCNVIGI